MSFLTPYISSKPLKIGILGGSFNPAHQGHLALSLKAHKKLRLDEIWWLITPQNQLKDNKETKDYQSRVEKAKTLLKDFDFLKISEYEREINSFHSFETINQLTCALPQHKFVWVCGADSFNSLPKWKNWEQIIRKIPFYIASRPTYHHTIKDSLPARKFKNYQIDKSKLHRLIHFKGKYWSYDDSLHCDLSSTKLRRIEKNTV